MTSVPHTRAPLHTPTAPFTGRRWLSRACPGDLAQTTWVRTDLDTVTWAEFTLSEGTTR